MFVHTSMWLPVVRRKASAGSHIARLAHQLRFHDRDVKANAVKAVTALHPKMTAHGQMVSRPNKPRRQTKQPNKFSEHMRKGEEHAFNTTKQADRPSKQRTTGSYRSVATFNAFASVCTMHTCLRAHASYSPCIATDITTDNNAAAMYSRSRVDTCAVAGGHTQMILSLRAKTSSSVSRPSVMCFRHTS